jgi:hypothetical protein
MIIVIDSFNDICFPLFSNRPTTFNELILHFTYLTNGVANRIKTKGLVEFSGFLYLLMVVKGDQFLLICKY